MGYPFHKRFCLGYTWLDEIPNGWRKAFGKQLLKDIKKIGKPYLKKINEHTGKKYKWKDIIFFEQIKEKYGELRLYASTIEEIQKVLDKYELMSSGYCINCGKPARYVTNGWIEYYCEKCFEKFECWEFNEDRNKIPLNKEDTEKYKAKCRLTEEYIPYFTQTDYEFIKEEIFSTEEDAEKRFRELWDNRQEKDNVFIRDYDRDKNIFKIKHEKKHEHKIDYGLDFKKMWGLNN